jgi:hypothetical protein
MQRPSKAKLAKTVIKLQTVSINQANRLAIIHYHFGCFVREPVSSADDVDLFEPDDSQAFIIFALAEGFFFSSLQINPVAKPQLSTYSHYKLHKDQLTGAR